MVAIGAALDLFVRLYPQHFRAEQITMAESLRAKTSDQRQGQLLAAEQGCMGVVVGLVNDAVAAGDVEILPQHEKKKYFHWIDNLRDWCISRQIWWGHRIPVWYCDDCDEIIVARNDPNEQEHVILYTDDVDE